MSSLEIPAGLPWHPPVANGPVTGHISLPGSKSLTARALVLAALRQEGPTLLYGALQARDTQLMQKALEVLGARFEIVPSTNRGFSEALKVWPINFRAAGVDEISANSYSEVFTDSHSGFPSTPTTPNPEIFCGLAGTVMRFLPPLVLLGAKTYIFRADAQASTRPITALLEALGRAGFDCEQLDKSVPGLPIKVTGANLIRRQQDASPLYFAVDSSGSSQFLSALLLLGAAVPGGVVVKSTGKLPSRPHVEMTLKILQDFGHEARQTAPDTWQVNPRQTSNPENLAGAHGSDNAAAGDQPLSCHDTSKAQSEPDTHLPFEFVIEPDLTNAGVFLAAAALTGGAVTVENWPVDTTQVGQMWQDILPRLGCQVHLKTAGHSGTSLEVNKLEDKPLLPLNGDFSAAGELVPTLCALALFAAGPSTLRGIGHLRGHETDRLQAITCEINRLGASATTFTDSYGEGIHIIPGDLHSATVETYADHRLATFACLVGLKIPGILLTDVNCTSKTLPNFTAIWSKFIHSRREPRAEISKI